MFRVISILLFITVLACSQTIQFSEEKYYEALDTTYTKKGKISFLKDKMKINYEGDDTVLTYFGDTLISQKGSEEKGSQKKELDLRKQPAVKLFFILFEAIYFDKKKILQSYFTIEKNNGISTLTPHKNIAQYIDSVHYKKVGKHLHFLKINLSNNDRILIEETY